MENNQLKKNLSWFVATFQQGKFYSDKTLIEEPLTFSPRFSLNSILFKIQTNFFITSVIIRNNFGHFLFYFRSGITLNKGQKFKNLINYLFKVFQMWGNPIRALFNWSLFRMEYKTSETNFYFVIVPLCTRAYKMKCNLKHNYQNIICELLKT